MPFGPLQLPPPAIWQDFEKLCHVLWREIWNDPATQKNGRSGQPQHGVDVFGQPNTGDEDPDEASGINLGSPLDARAPIEVAVNFTLFFPSPYAGAPDFNRKFTMRIDLPSGYRRTIETPVAPVEAE